MWSGRVMLTVLVDARLDRGKWLKMKRLGYWWVLVGIGGYW